MTSVIKANDATHEYCVHATELYEFFQQAIREKVIKTNITAIELTKLAQSYATRLRD